MTWFALIALLTATPADTSPKETYSAILKRVLADDPTIDYCEFRIAGTLANNPDEGKRQTFDRAAFRQKQQAGDNQGALEVATKALDRNYASLVNHLDAMFAYQNLNNAAAAAKHEKIVNALLESIRNSGDGKEPETASLVVSSQEVYIFIARALNLKAKTYTFIQQNQHYFDRIEVVDPPTGQSRYLWFNAAVELGAYRPAR
jgi:hypothetical protein